MIKAAALSAGRAAAAVQIAAARTQAALAQQGKAMRAAMIWQQDHSQLVRAVAVALVVRVKAHLMVPRPVQAALVCSIL